MKKKELREILYSSALEVKLQGLIHHLGIDNTYLKLAKHEKNPSGIWK